MITQLFVVYAEKEVFHARVTLSCADVAYF